MLSKLGWSKPFIHLLVVCTQLPNPYRHGTRPKRHPPTPPNLLRCAAHPANKQLKAAKHLAADATAYKMLSSSKVSSSCTQRGSANGPRSRCRRAADAAGAAAAKRHHLLHPTTQPRPRLAKTTAAAAANSDNAQPLRQAGPSTAAPDYAAIDSQPLNRVVMALFRRKMVAAIGSDSELEGCAVLAVEFPSVHAGNWA